MSAAATSLVKPLSMAERCCLTSIPSLFTTKTRHPFLSIPSKPIKPSHISCSSSSSFSSWVFHKIKNSAFNVVPLVAQTSDWAQQQEEEEGGVKEQEGEIVASASGDEGWEGEAGDPEDGEESYPEPPE